MMAGLGSNKAVTELAKKFGGNAFDFLSAGAKSSHSAYKAAGGGAGNILNSIGQGHMKKGADLALANLDPAKVAGSYMAASGAYRIASGGGAYKDKHGNSNIIGVPFI